MTHIGFKFHEWLANELFWIGLATSVSVHVPEKRVYCTWRYRPIWKLRMWFWDLIIVISGKLEVPLSKLEQWADKVLEEHPMTRDELREKILEVLIDYYGFATDDVADRVMALLDDETGLARILLESALEHGSHAWARVEYEGEGLDCWPPEVPHTETGTLHYHLAAMIAKVYELYNRMPLERKDEQ